MAINGQADILANDFIEGTAAHGDLEPEDTWLRWADFANNVFHFWRLVGPRLRERPDDEPRVKLPREPVAEEPEILSVEMCFRKHHSCLACTRQTGKVKGNYNFAYLTKQSCRTFKKRKKKKRRTGFAVEEARVTGPAAGGTPGRTGDPQAG
eukprot:5610447-Amphidinium_carterae.1